MSKIKSIHPPEAPEVAAYFSRSELVKTIVGGERGDPDVQDPVLELVLQIPGICVATVRPYIINVTKAPTYEWPEIDPQVEKLIRSFDLLEGHLEKQPKKESKMQPNDLSPAELGNGYRLQFQKAPDGRVRAIIKDPSGALIVKGVVVPEAEAYRSRMDVLASPESARWLPGSSRPEPSPTDFCDVEEEEPDQEDEEEAE